MDHANEFPSFLVRKTAAETCSARQSAFSWPSEVSSIDPLMVSPSQAGIKKRKKEKL